MTSQMMMLTTMFAVAGTQAACEDAKPTSTSGDPGVAVANAAGKPGPELEIERGRYLVTAAGCHDCHTPLQMGPNGPEPDMSRALSGHPAAMQLPPPPQLPAGPWLVTVAATNTAWSGPWGVSFTANLTPDRATGIGTWTRQNFIETIRNGRHLGAGRPLLPPMPSAVYANFTDADLGAMFAYLKSVPALSNQVPEPIAPTQVSTAPAEPTQVSRQSPGVGSRTE